ncbi:YlbF family regulator [bacterium]|nr:YlbF family regulator [bacterium]
MSIQKKAMELGIEIGKSQEFKAARRAEESLGTEDDLRGHMGEMQALQDQAMGIRSRGNQVPEEMVKKMEGLQMKIEANTKYQQFIATQTNLQKVMESVNKTIGEGMEKGLDKKIITL